jgi:hypothetical protein
MECGDLSPLSFVWRHCLSKKRSMEEARTSRADQRGTKPPGIESADKSAHSKEVSEIWSAATCRRFSFVCRGCLWKKIATKELGVGLIKGTKLVAESKAPTGRRTPN